MAELNKFVKRLLPGGLWDKYYKLENIVGLTESEIKNYAEFYDINISGDLLEFLRVMGRCSGKIIPSSALHILNQNYTKETMLEIKDELLDDIDEIGWMSRSDLIDKGIFCFSIENEGIDACFLLTKSDQPSRVYVYDEYRVEDYGRTFVEHLIYHERNYFWYKFHNLEQMIADGRWDYVVRSEIVWD